MKRVMVILFAMALVCLSANIASAQPGVATDFNTVTLTIETALAVTGGVDVAFTVAPGISYSIKTDGHAIPLLPDGTDVVDPLVWTIEGQLGAPVTMTFTLPRYFYSVNTGVYISLTYGTADGLYDNQGNDDGITGTAFNPNSPYSDFIGPNGAASVFLGYNFSVPPNAPASDDYIATFALTVSTTGL